MVTNLQKTVLALLYCGLIRLPSEEEKNLFLRNQDPDCVLKGIQTAKQVCNWNSFKSWKHFDKFQASAHIYVCKYQHLLATAEDTELLALTCHISPKESTFRHRVQWSLLSDLPAYNEQEQMRDIFTSSWNHHSHSLEINVMLNMFMPFIQLQAHLQLGSFFP